MPKNVETFIEMMFLVSSKHSAVICLNVFVCLQSCSCLIDFWGLNEAL